MIATALLLQAAVPVTVARIAPFTVEANVSRLESPSYPFPQSHEFKSTVLQWKSPGGLTVYRLSDDGEYVTVSYHIKGEGGWCQTGPDPIRLSAKPDVQFDIKCKLLGAAKAKLLATEMRAARPYFRAAYASFYKATLQQHGPRLQRCRETASGNHGTICVAFWDEGRSANDQQKNKRTN